MNKKEFVEKTEQEGHYKILGLFFNETGEEYLVMDWKNKELVLPERRNIVFFAGDETDWEIYEYDLFTHKGYTSFLLNPFEKNAIEELIIKDRDK